ncbi:MAG TPA: antiterminator LoaP, partial [Anaerovoracaceae bacterium]|nr:antiterminator LoaP [Anaerovoracaceae bacterium]
DICRNLKEILHEGLYENCFVPMSERHYRKCGKDILLKEPLFPGYLFIVSDYIEKVASAIRQTSKFKRILRTGDCFTPMEEKEVESFAALADSNFNVTMSKGFIVGDAIVVTKGPLKGYESHIEKIARHKRIAFIRLPFLRKDAKVRVPLEIIDKC